MKPTTRTSRWRSDVVFGEPQQHGGTTIIPATREGPFGSKALGVVAIDEAGTSWVPAVDGDRVAFVAVLTGLIAGTLATLAVLRQPPWPTSAAMIAMNHDRFGGGTRAGG